MLQEMEEHNAYGMAIEHQINIIIRLLNGFEYFDSGLCRLNFLLSQVEDDNSLYIDTVLFIEQECPEPRYSMFTYRNQWSWKPGEADPRYYWLKDKLKEYKNTLRNYER